MSTVPIVVIHYRTTAKPFVAYREPTDIHLLTSTFACVITHSSLMSMAVHWLWCIWHLCACVLRFWRGVWGVRSHRRGTQGGFHPNYLPGKLNASDILNRLLHPTICAPVAHLIIIIMLCLIINCCSLHFSALEDEAGFDEYMVWNAIPLFILGNGAIE